MKQIVSVWMILLIFVGLTAYTAEGTEPETKAETTAAAESDVWPAEHGENLPITEEDVDMLYRMAYFLDYTSDYDSAAEGGERFLCCGFFGEALFTLCDAYDIPADTISYETEETDPLGLMPYYESTEGKRYWHWSRIDAGAADYIVRNVFNTRLSVPGDPAATIKRGYYYLDGYYYINTSEGGIECSPQIASCTLGDNGRYNIWMDWGEWIDIEDCSVREIYGSILVEASLHMVDRHRMWTIHSIRTLTDDPAQPMG